MSLQCPCCHSPKVASFHHAMKIGAAIGTVGGAARGVSAALAGSQTGALIGAIAGPIGITLGSVSGAILGGLTGGAGGCALGAQLGDTLDRHVLAHNLCLLCGHRFHGLVHHGAHPAMEHVVVHAEAQSLLHGAVRHVLNVW